ncbi:MAG: DUF4180 domain-containing protein [Bacteroidales bacterium]|jgi:hypothetical protein|nr:DUF4180 domain-containing protein [Bacteroidales bacterium]
MIRYHNTDTSSPVAEVTKDSAIITSASDMLDIIGDISYSGSSRVIIHSESFSKEFFDLRSGIAGDILQKFSNYRMRLAIVGDFSHLTSRSWLDFIRESNRGKTVMFVSTIDDAIIALHK